MRKANKKSRKFRFYSEKNKQMIEVYDERALKVAKEFEENPYVNRYEACVPLDMTRYSNVNRVDIRKDYFETEWESDFMVHYVDGTSRIIELVSRKRLEKRSFIEQLDFSVRYWNAMNVRWMVSIPVMPMIGDETIVGDVPPVADVPPVVNVMTNGGASDD